MTLNEAKNDIGNTVIYTSRHDCQELGVIHSVNHKYIFVQFGADNDDGLTGPQACRPDSLISMASHRKNKRWRDILND